MTTRRQILRGAAWATPAVMIASAAPLAAASISNATSSFTASRSGLLTLNLLDSPSFITSQSIITVPTELSIVNGAGAIVDAPVTANITVGRPAGINLPVGRARGLGVYSFDGVQTTIGQRTATYQSAPIIGQYGFPLTTFTTTLTPVSIAPNGTRAFSLNLGLAGVSTGVSISAPATFPITATLNFGAGQVLSASTSVVVPIGSGIL